MIQGILMTSSVIPYVKILHPHMGHPTPPGPQDPHHLNPALANIIVYSLPWADPVSKVEGGGFQ